MMPWAIFTEDYEHDFRPRRAVCQTIRAAEKPQEWPEPVIAAAVAAGKAECVSPPTETRREIKRRSGASKPQSSTKEN